MPVRSQQLSLLRKDNFDLTVNPYVAKVFDALSKGDLALFHGNKLSDRKGQWRTVFSSNLLSEQKQKKLFLEIGSYKGKTSIEWAQRYPQHCFIGMDITFKRVFISAQRSRIAQLENLCWLLARGQQISEIFSEDELNGVTIFFPDPWQKKLKHKKNQLIGEEFVRDLSTVLQKGAFFWIKTDSAAYWQDICNTMKLFDYMIYSTFHPEDLANTQPSVFESLFSEQKIPIYQGVWYNHKIHKVNTLGLPVNQIAST